MFKKSLLAICFIFTSFILVQARTVSECKTELKEIAQSLVDNNIQNPKISLFIQTSSDLSEEDLIDMCDQILLYRKDISSKAGNVETIKNELIDYLRNFVASEMDIPEVDLNFAFFVNEQNPDFTVIFKNPAGEIRTRKYALKIKSVGLKFELVIKIDAIKILGSGFNYYDSMNKEYELGFGFDMGYYPDFYGTCAYTNNINIAIAAQDFLPTISLFVKGKWRAKSLVGACLTFAKIKETNCLLMIGGIAFGLGGSFTWTGIEGALVTGGKMTPIAE
jgi:hypothetical protein